MAAQARLRPGSSGLLLCTVAASVAVQGALPPGRFQQVLVSVLLAANLILAMLVGRVTPRRLRLAALLALAGVAVNLLRALADVVGEGEVRGMNALVVLFCPPAVAIGVVRALRETRAVRIEAVTGVLSLYMLLGLLFAFVFGAVDHLGGAPFFADDTPATVASCVYYSFVTLATVGYGDIVARTDLGHTLSIFEALIGQIYLVTVVSLIVSNLGRRNGTINRDD